MKLVLVEDQEKLNKYIKENLEQEGFAVDSYMDGQDALDNIELNHESIDLIILDIMLPSVDGLTICKTIREEEIDTPVLILTARDHLNDKISGFNIGADDYLTKPFSLDELTVRVKALLRRPKPIRPNEIVIRDLVVDLNKQSAAIKDKNLSLTTKEFRILEYLIVHKGQIIERDMVLDKIWNNEYNSFSNVVDVHIKNLRRKLKGYGDIIETVRGVGYRFIDN